MNLHNELQDLGLSKNQARIYLLLYKHGLLSISEIAKKLKISRSSVYTNVDKLLDLQLIGTVRRGQNRIAYRSLGVSQVYETIAKQRKHAEQVVEELMESYERDVYSSKIYFFEKFSKEVHELIWDEQVGVKNNTFIYVGRYELWRKYVVGKEKMLF